MSKFPFFAKLSNRERTLIQVVGSKVTHNDNEYKVNGKTIRMPGNTVEMTAYEVLGTGEVQWESFLDYIKVHQDVVEKDFPEYII